MLHRHLIFSFVLLVQETGTIIADDLYLCIELVSTATTDSRVIWINRVRLPNLLVVSCIRGKYIYMYWYSTAVCIGLYTRYQYIFYLGTWTFVHGSLLLYNMHIYVWSSHIAEYGSTG